MVNDISESYICVLNPEAAYKNGEEVATPHPPKLWSVFKQQSLNAELSPPRMRLPTVPKPWFAGKTGDVPYA